MQETPKAPSSAENAEARTYAGRKESSQSNFSALQISPDSLESLNRLVVIHVNTLKILKIKVEDRHGIIDIVKEIIEEEKSQ